MKKLIGMFLFLASFNTFASMGMINSTEKDCNLTDHSTPRFVDSIGTGLSSIEIKKQSDSDQ